MMRLKIKIPRLAGIMTVLTTYVREVGMEIMGNIKIEIKEKEEVEVGSTGV
jgi:hypothetical protein